MLPYHCDCLFTNTTHPFDLSHYEWIWGVAHVACQIHGSLVDSSTSNSNNNNNNNNNNSSSTSTRADRSSQKSLELLCLSTLGSDMHAADAADLTLAKRP